MKLFTKIICDIISEQQEFRKNRSTTDAIFIIRQIVEKSIEYEKPTYMCFIELSKAFDRVRLNEITTMLRRGSIPEEIELLKS